MHDNWLIFCEESGDKALPWKKGSTDYYIVSAVLVLEEMEHNLIEVIKTQTKKTLRIKTPLEWKKLETFKKRDDILLAKFFKNIESNAPPFIISKVVCNKHETMGPGLIDTQTFMNYLYGLMFKRISLFLRTTKSHAKLVIDRNTDPIAQESLRKYLSDVAKYKTGEPPRFSKPKWLNPEDHAILGLSDFIAGSSLRSLTDYHHNVSSSCKTCGSDLCIYECKRSNFSYFRSYKYLVEWNYFNFTNWSWKGLLYHPFEFKNNYRHLFIPI